MFSWLGYKQYFANLTRINEQYENTRPHVEKDSEGSDRSEGIHSIQSKRPIFNYEIEYDTRNDSIWNLQDLTVKSYIKLARRIGRYQPPSLEQEEPSIQASTDSIEVFKSEETDSCSTWHTEGELLRCQAAEIDGKKKHKHKKKKKHHRKDANRAWYTFLKRAYVGWMDDDDLKDIFDVDVE